ncbi:MAG: hypothetical protein IKO85_03325 [Bacteroidaceae bacterium]|nr:hypothetical protein [Bacteroidaceae bacterium]
MKKYFWLLATVLISCVTLMSCGSDDDETPTPNNLQSGDKTFNVYASAVLDKNLAEYGYMEVTYTCQGKTETFQLKKGDASEKFPTADNFGVRVLSFAGSQLGVTYTDDNFIIRNVQLKNLKMDESAVFKYKFVVAENRPEYTEKSDFVVPGVVGYATGSYSVVYSSLQYAKGLKVEQFESWLEKRTIERTLTFSPNQSQE